MIKKKSSKQNIIIVILCILLLISIAFGFTYSYYNGKTNLVKGSITTANLAIELHDNTGKTEFLMTTDSEKALYAPGCTLQNIPLNLYNKSSQPTYMAVVFSLSAKKNDGLGSDGLGTDVTPQLTNTPAVEFADTAFNTSVWKSIQYVCDSNTIYTCLVGLNVFESRASNEEGKTIPLLAGSSLKVPTSWGNVLQDCTVTISVRAYAVQYTLGDEYLIGINSASNDENKAQAIARAVLEICGVDTTIGTI